MLGKRARFRNDGKAELKYSGEKKGFTTIMFFCLVVREIKGYTRDRITRTNDRWKIVRSK